MTAPMDSEKGVTDSSTDANSKQRLTFQPSAQFSPPYSVFGRGTIFYLTYLLGYLTLASSLTATIYFPLINLLAERYRTSVQLINLTITLYVVLQGIAPSFFAPLSDTLGRRPIFLASFAIYLLASIGLVLGSNYTALLLLRALQSIGGSAVLSLAYGVVSDVVPHSERGSVLGPMMAATNLGPCIGPLIGGGAILATANPTWCFVALVAFGASALMLIGWTMPETCRSVVGNGAIRPRGIWVTWWKALGSLRLHFTNRAPQSGAEKKTELSTVESLTVSAGEDSEADVSGRGKLSLPNPFPSVRIIFYRDTALILWLCAAPYAVWYCIQTSIPLIYGSGYGFNDLEVGLCFLAGGAGVITGGFIAGRLMDWNFRRLADKTGLPREGGAVEILQFPIEQARSNGSTYIMLISIGAVVGYGWAVQRRVHPALPLVLQFYIGTKCTVLHQIYSALIVDIFPMQPGTAAASNNICRCALSAVAIAVLQPVVNNIGYSWLFTGLGLIEGITSIAAVFVLRRWGWRWRKARDGERGGA